MSALDWTIIVVYFVFSAAIGVYYTRRAGSSIEEFFLSGRNLPWWLAGTSMVATTFAADTPLAVTELVARNGVAGNWLWWNFAFGNVLTVFFFARLWRRAGVLTDVELVELRYSGRPAAVLRGFRALYLGLFINSVIMAWVNLAMASILEGMFGIPHRQVVIFVALSLVLTAAYSALSGMWGVAVTDLFQFALAMGGTILLAFVVLALPQIGGVSGLAAQLPEWSLRVLPTVAAGGSALPTVAGGLALSLFGFLAYVGVQWWAAWYPGSEPGGGGYVAQRMMSSKDERHSLFATLWFTVAHYCLRPWPWIVVGLATLVLYPDLAADQKRLGYVYAMRDFLPSGLKGMLVASFFAAYMSTISTQLNWGTSYVINDFYRRFVRRSANERELVAVSRLTTILLMVLSLLAMAVLPTIATAWEFVVEAGAGLGLVLILRWYWWRVSAWSEIAAMVAALVAYAANRFVFHVPFPESLFPIVGATTAVWLLVTYLTAPTESERLRAFFRRVRPGGPGWGPLAREMPEVKRDTGLGRLALDWLLGVVVIYCALFAIGRLIFGDYVLGTVLVAVAVACAAVLWRDLRRIGATPEDASSVAPEAGHAS
jgi:solute:Na+ symporter, SSS family